MSECWRFAAWSFHPQSGVLEIRGYSTTLEPRVARLLLFLLEHNGEVLSHEELMAGVWDGRVVSDEAVRRAVSELRHILARDGGDRHVMTLRKRGYRACFPLPDPPPERGVPARWWSLLAGLALVLVLASVVLLATIRGEYRESPAENASTTRAQEEYLRARELMESYVHADLVQAMRHLRNAIALDPNMAPAYTLLATALLTRANDNDSEDYQAVVDAARPLVDRALALDFRQPEAWMLRAMLMVDTDIRQAEANLRHAMQLNPTLSRPYEMLAGLLVDLPGHEDEALDLIDRARALEPMRARNHHIKAHLMLRRCNYAAAESLSRRALAVDPDFRASLVLLGRIASIRGNPTESVRLKERALALDPDSDWVRLSLHRAYLNNDQIAAARSLESRGSMAARWREAVYLGDYAVASALLHASQPYERRHLADWEVLYSLLWGMQGGDDPAAARDFLGRNWAFTGAVPAEPRREETPFLIAALQVWYGPELPEPGQSRLRMLYASLLAAHRSEATCLHGGEAVVLLLTALALGETRQALELLAAESRHAVLFANWHWMLRSHPRLRALCAQTHFAVC